jgi:hypothetical protein
MTLCLAFLLRACAGASSRIPLAFIIALGLGASGCQDKANAPPEQSAPSAVPAASPASSPEKTALLAASAASSPDKTSLPTASAVASLEKTLSPVAAVASSPEVMVIKSMDVGDRACYVALENAQGQRSDEMASFEICEQDKLIGQRVHLKREPTAIMAMSCQGDPECTKQETVNLIVAAEKAR